MRQQRILTGKRYDQDAKAAVAALSKAGILGGYPDESFRPEQTATRAEATMVLYKVMETME